MSTPVSAEQGEGIQVNFQPVPEINASQFRRTANMIWLRRKLHMQSYGAFIVRGGGETAVTDFMQLMARRATTRNPHYVTYEFPGEISELHDDIGAHVRNDVTAHLTTEGICEALVLTKTTAPEQLDPKKGPVSLAELLPRWQATNALFDEGQFSGPMPRLALKTMIDTNDVLFFDHTQPHAFRAVDGPRKSVAIAFTQE